ncbi:MAG TPA: hypothetical protein DHU93_15840 [Algoriphagus sp.]|jgi:hypothetical protein|uniref:hypothetical protein n=1 Tax=unclassified Algoriphagus TaxID=2641541 RepID=UPI000EF1039A|nr:MULTISPECIES: hypothetical protein [unclassified Algoriphagus]HCX76645.1 hypothetical protein [Algoriphagus sp.]|tara:strand:+ start:23604 stop:23792 length:189 start_codon:yes stop_codon:yes gene_type:complete
MKKIKILICSMMLLFGVSFSGANSAVANEWWSLYEIIGDDGTLYWADCMPVSGDCFVVAPQP